MDWIVGIDKEIAGNREQLQARKEYIRQVTGANVSKWETIAGNGLLHGFVICTSLDGVDGTVVTAHIYDVWWLAGLDWVFKKPLLVANTCVWQVGNDKKLLAQLQEKNPEIELRFAKQEIQFNPQASSVRLHVKLSNVGTFGFCTSKSERELFEDSFQFEFRPALERAFPRVCGVQSVKNEAIQIS